MKFIPHTEEDIKVMLEKIGLNTLRDLFKEIPEDVLLTKDLDLPSGISEIELRNKVNSLNQKNAHIEKYISFLGAGAYDHYRPAVIDHLLSRSEFYTAYTPYQPEVSQGTLQAIFEFQTAICELTGMDIANASLYDGATALAEGVIMAVNHTRKDKVLISSTVHPEYREVVKTYAFGRDIQVMEIPYRDGLTDLEKLETLISDEYAAVVLQNPNFFGGIEDIKKVIDLAHSRKCLIILSVDPISLGILEAPGKLGVDIVVGEGQGLGIPLSFGGPYLGFLATKKNFMRKIPGRLVGVAEDRKGRQGFVLTLQAREQHIRREKASSNICSNQALCALAATIYLCTLGKKGIREVAEQCLCKSNYALKVLSQIKGVEIAFPENKIFKEFVIKTEEDVASINNRLSKANILGGLNLDKYYPELKNHMLICVTETKSKSNIDLLKKVWEGEF